MPKHFFFLTDLSLLAVGDVPADGAVDTQLAAVPEWVNVLPEPETVDGELLIYSRDGRVLHIDSMEKLAARSNKALKRQKGGGLVDADHKAAMSGGAAIAWAEAFEARPGKGLWARADWLAAGEQLVGSKQYRYTSSVVSGPVDAEVDLEQWTVTWHITPDTVDGFAITNIPALATTSMFAERSEELEREAILAVLLKQLKVDGKNPTMTAVREAFGKLRQFTTSVDGPDPNIQDPAPISDSTPPLGDEVAAEQAAPTPIEPPAVEAEQLRAELAAARLRIAALEVEAGTAFVKSLLHSGKLTPAQRKAADEQARTPTGLAQLRALYEHAPTILPTERTLAAGPDSSADVAPHGLDPHAYTLARQGMPAHEIARQLQQRGKENTR